MCDVRPYCVNGPRPPVNRVGHCYGVLTRHINNLVNEGFSRRIDKRVPHCPTAALLPGVHCIVYYPIQYYSSRQRVEGAGTALWVIWVTTPHHTEVPRRRAQYECKQESDNGILLAKIDEREATLHIWHLFRV